MPGVYELPANVRDAAELLWSFHRMDHDLRPASVGVGLGSHDIGVATQAAGLYRRGLFSTVIFSGATTPTTQQRFPAGEAVHFRDHAVSLGVPPAAVYVETRATSTPENALLSRQVLDAAGVTVESAIVVSRPYQQRRAYGIFVKLWPGVEIMCSGQPVAFDDYVAGIGDTKRVVDMLVGDTQRLQLDGRNGWAIPQEIPTGVWRAYERLIDACYTSRVITSPLQPLSEASHAES